MPSSLIQRSIRRFSSVCIQLCHNYMHKLYSLARLFGVSDLAELVATRKDRFVKKYVLSLRDMCYL